MQLTPNQPRTLPDPRGAVAAAVAHPEKVGHVDGIPHDVIGLLAVICVVTVGLTLLAFLMFGGLVALVVGVAGAWLMMRRLPRRARREQVAEAVAELPVPPADGRPT